MHLDFHLPSASRPFFISFTVPPWRAVRSYRPHLEERYPFEVMTSRTAPSSDGFLAEISGFSSALRQMPGELCTAPRIISLSPLSLATDITEATHGTSSIWLRTRTGAGGNAILAYSFFGRSPRLHGQQVQIFVKQYTA